MKGDLLELKKLYKKAKDAYYNSDPVMSDAEFDALEDKIKKLDPDWSGLKKTGASVKKAKTQLAHYMPSLAKKYPEEFDKWWARSKWKSVVASNKLDGSSLQLTYRGGSPVKLVTRGDGETGGDISYMIPHLGLPKIKTKSTVIFRCEALIPIDTFKRRYAKTYDNPRNLVNGVLNRSASAMDLKVLKDVHVVVLGVYGYTQLEGLGQASDWGLRVVSFAEVRKGKMVAEHLSSLLSLRRKESPYEMDGLVLMDGDQPLEYKDNDRPKFAIAFKENTALDDAHEAIVKDIVWQTSHSGRLNPKIIIKPTRIGGVTVKQATAHNPMWMVEKGIGPGAVVRIVRSGDVIPKIVHVVKAADVKWPDTKYKWDGKFIYETEVSDEAVVKSIYRFLINAGVEHVAVKTVRKLYDSEQKRFQSILGYARFVHQAVTSPTKAKRFLVTAGLGPKQSQIVLSELMKLQNMTMQQAMVGSCMFPPGIGDRRLEQIQSKYSLSKLLANADATATVESLLVQIKGIGDEIAAQFAQGLKVYAGFHAKLSAYFPLEEAKRKASVKKNGACTGMYGTWTGYRSKDEEAAFENAGGTIVAFSSKTTHLFYREGGKASSKVTKAGDRATTWAAFSRKFLKG